MHLSVHLQVKFILPANKKWIEMLRQVVIIEHKLSVFMRQGE